MHITSPHHYVDAVDGPRSARGTHGDRAGGARRAGFEAAAERIGVEPADLSRRLRAGETLGGLASKAGVATEELKSVMTEAIKATAPPKAADRIIANLDNVIIGNRPHRPTGETQDPAQAIETLAATLDTDVNKLMESVEDGSFRDLLAENKVHPALGLLVNVQL